MSQMDDLDLIAKAYGSQVGAIRRQLQSFGDALWQALPDYRDENIDMLVQAIVPRVKAGQIQIANLTVAYVKQTLMAMGVKAPVTGVDEAAITSLRGVDPQEVYRRPAVSVYTALSHGKPFDQAVKEGGLRLYQLIGGDMQLAKTRQAHRSMRRARVGGVQFYRRILTGRENCGLCVVASTQHYRVDHVMPIHPGCDCDFGPLPPGTGQEWVIDPDTLEQVHSAVEERYGESDRGARSPDYSKMIMTTTHGEYGPVISWKETIAERRALARSTKLRSLSFSSSGSLDTGVAGFSRKRNERPRISQPIWRTRKLKTPRSKKSLQAQNSQALSAMSQAGVCPEGYVFPEVRLMPAGEEKLGSGEKIGEFLNKTTREIIINRNYKDIFLTLLHEHGHALDFYLGNKAFLSENSETLAGEIVESLLNTPTGKVIPKGGYLASSKEVFARGFAQYIVTRTGNTKYLNRLKSLNEANQSQWTDEEFTSVIPLFDRLFSIE